MSYILSFLFVLCYHQANQQLLNIRELELSYFTTIYFKYDPLIMSFFLQICIEYIINELVYPPWICFPVIVIRLVSFAIICMLVGMNTINTLTQVAALDSDVNIYINWIFWTVTDVSVIACVHCVLCSVFTGVYGSGLALRGPQG